ncbi:hypothetical protein PVAP13_2NG563300 [Panicum virgatum]|uniref:Uncharacterized protein n=1 Tax=Panicum virgatum TaxID=38727 RepID=A0A8T0W3I7_PANVG|nr:hypothetical protein PVAP13_2NG563300 [Panicum virgatum]
MYTSIGLPCTRSSARHVFSFRRCRSSSTDTCSPCTARSRRGSSRAASARPSTTRPTWPWCGCRRTGACPSPSAATTAASGTPSAEWRTTRASAACGVARRSPPRSSFSAAPCSTQLNTESVFLPYVQLCLLPSDQAAPTSVHLPLL